MTPLGLVQHTHTFIIVSLSRMAAIIYLLPKYYVGSTFDSCTLTIGVA